MTRYTINLTKKVLKQLRELDEPVKNKILETLVVIENNILAISLGSD